MQMRKRNVFDTVTEAGMTPSARLRRRLCRMTVVIVFATVALSGIIAAEDYPDELYISYAPESKASSVQDWKPAPWQWREMLDTYTSENIFPGVSVLIKSPNWGVRFVGSGQPIIGRDDMEFKPTTQFRIGSCSKATVSIVMLQLDYEHKLNLDDPITMHLPPEITSKIPYAEDITIRNCLDMTSGIRSYTDINLFGDPQPETATLHFDPVTILTMAMDDNTATFLPDSTINGEIHNYDYSNSGYLLCGLIAQRIEKKPLQDILRERVFDKIGMTDTFLATDYRITRRMAHGYTAFYETGAWQDCIIYDQSVPWAAGAVVSTPFDLLNFYETIFESDRLIKPVSRRKFLRMNYAAEHYGYGKAILEEISSSGSMLGHGGTVLGFLTLMLYSPDSDYYYVCYTNTWDNKESRGELFNRITHLALGCPESPTPSDGGTIQRKKGAATLAWHSGNVSGEEYHVYIGTSESAVYKASADNHPGVSLDRVNGLSFVKNNLEPGRRYYWRVDCHHKRTEREIQIELDNIDSLMSYFNMYTYHDVSEYETIPGPVWAFTVQ